MSIYDGYDFITIEHSEQEKEFVGNILHIQPNDLSILFFRDDNVKKINDMLINEMLELSEREFKKKVRIEPQDTNMMLQIMRAVYFKNVQNCKNIARELNKLNHLTLELLIPTVYNGMVHQIKYLETYNRQENIPLERPQNTKQKAALRPMTRLFGF